MSWMSKVAKTNPNYSQPLCSLSFALRLALLPNLKVGPGPGGALDASTRPGPAAQSLQIQFLISFKEQEVRLVRCSFASRVKTDWAKRKPKIFQSFVSRRIFCPHSSQWCQECGGPISFFVPAVTKIFGDWFYIDTRHQCVVICCQDTIWNVPVWLHSWDARIVVNTRLSLVAKRKYWPLIGQDHSDTPLGRSIWHKCSAQKVSTSSDRPGYFKHEARHRSLAAVNKS